MMAHTTIPLDSRVRDRLRTFGTAGMSYSDIITATLDRIEREGFLREIQRRVDDPDVEWVDLDDVEWD